jgi:eukaryotic-like serine/threonine-protein kinase
MTREKPPLSVTRTLPILSDDARKTLTKRGVHHVELRDTIASPPPAAPIGNMLLEPFKVLDAPEARYHVVERLGIGGMGEVSTTIDAKIGREIALKTMIAQSPEEIELAQSRFLREARVQAILEHPAIVPVYDIGIGPDGKPFFTMKRIRGETLFTMIEDVRVGQRATLRRISRTRLLSAFMTVCMAIDYAHQRGIIHRDLKPENIMLGPQGEVYVLDWGLARVMDPKNSRSHTWELGDSGTRPGDMIGTPGFMSPEQVLGQHDEVDARSDVYALGCILFEILTFRGLHDGRDVMAVLESTLNPTRSLPTVGPDVAPELVAIVERATRFHKDQRFPSARMLSEAIERYLDGDRDSEARTKLAKERIAQAKSSLEVAVSGPAADREHARVMALRQAGGALALAPQNPEATATVLEVLSHPPAKTPVDVERELERLEEEHARAAMRDNSLRVLSWLVVVPFGLLMGVKAGLPMAIVLGLLAWCCGLALYQRSRQRTSANSRLLLFTSTSALFGSMSGIFGPFVLIPALAAINTVVFCLQAAPRERPALLGVGVSAFLVPMLLEVSGLVAPSMTFTNDTLMIQSRILSFPPALTFLFLATVSSFGILTPVLITGRLRDQLRRVERQLALQKWQFAQLSNPE